MDWRNIAWAVALLMIGAWIGGKMPGFNLLGKVA